MKGKKIGQALRYLVLWLILAGLLAGIWVIGKGSPKVQEPGGASLPEETSSPVEDPAEEASAGEGESSEPPAEETDAPREMRGVWVSYLSLQAESADGFREQYRGLTEQAAKAGVTAMFVHVRPFCDALYPSQLYPWSHILTGMQGEDPGFDPLSYMIETTHAAGMEFHAWINPMRVRLSKTPARLSEDSPYRMRKESDPYYFLETESGIYLNPAYSEVRELIAAGVEEIVSNYPVDGIHFDDYFYPADMDGQDEPAYRAYAESAGEPLSLEDWRAANINAMVSQAYLAAKSADSSVQFGIAPQGNPENNRVLGADVAEWCAARGYLDYICPQLYFSYENPALGYSQALEEWMELEKYRGLQVYIGLALYKIGTDSDSGTWPKDASIIEEQIADARSAGADGVIFFDISCLELLQTRE